MPSYKEISFDPGKDVLSHEKEIFANEMAQVSEGFGRIGKAALKSEQEAEKIFYRELGSEYSDIKELVKEYNLQPPDDAIVEFLFAKKNTPTNLPELYKLYGKRLYLTEVHKLNERLKNKNFPYLIEFVSIKGPRSWALVLVQVKKAK